LHKEAENFFKEYDKNLFMDSAAKAEHFDDHMSELVTSINMATKKFRRIDEKMEELGKVTEHFHDSTDRLEELYKRDIEQRKKHFQEQQLKQVAGSKLSDSLYISGLNLD
jgi:Cu/Ag efflux protein CusF